MRMTPKKVDFWKNNCFPIFCWKIAARGAPVALFACGCLLGPRICLKPLRGLVCWLQHWPERITVCLTGKWVTWKTWRFQRC